MYVPQLLGALILVAAYLAGVWLAAFFGLAVPGSILGLVFCTVAMLASPAALQRIRPGAIVLLGLIPLFLVPLTTRMVVRLDFSSPATWRALITLCIASALGTLVAGLVARLCLRRD